MVLTAIANGEIICAPCLHGHLEGEFILDPRNLSYSVEPIVSASTLSEFSTRSMVGEARRPQSPSAVPTIHHPIIPS